MGTTIRSLAASATIVGCLSAGGASTWAAGPVTSEPFSFQFTEQDELLTTTCGFPVQATVAATGIDRYFEPRPGGLAYLGTQQSNITFSARGNTVVFRERGQERAVENPDGTFTFLVTGRFLGANSIGRLTVNTSTDEILSQTGTSVDFARICAILSS